MKISSFSAFWWEWVFFCTFYTNFAIGYITKVWKGGVLTNPKLCATIALQLQKQTERKERKNGKKKNVQRINYWERQILHSHPLSTSPISASHNECWWWRICWYVEKCSALPLGKTLSPWCSWRCGIRHNLWWRTLVNLRLAGTQQDKTWPILQRTS